MVKLYKDPMEGKCFCENLTADSEQKNYMKHNTSSHTAWDTFKLQVQSLALLSHPKARKK